MLDTTPSTHSALESAFQEAFASATVPACYEDAARNTFRAEMARVYVAMGGSPDTANAYLASFGLRVRDIDVMVAS
jgi:hypothetical protein